MSNKSIFLMLFVVVGGPLLAWRVLGLPEAGNLGAAFGMGGALVSGIALIIAMRSSAEQSRMQAKFNEGLMRQLDQQAAALEVVKKSLQTQANGYKVFALQHLIAIEDARIEQLKQWGKQYGDESRYKNGISACEARIKSHNNEIQKITEARVP